MFVVLFGQLCRPQAEYKGNTNNNCKTYLGCYTSISNSSKMKDTFGSIVRNNWIPYMMYSFALKRLQ